MNNARVAATPLWRGDLAKRRTAPLQCEALAINLWRSTEFGVAAQPSGDKSPRHRKVVHSETVEGAEYA